MIKALIEGMCSEQAFPFERHTTGLVEEESLPSRGLPSCFPSMVARLQGD